MNQHLMLYMTLCATGDHLARRLRPLKVIIVMDPIDMVWRRRRDDGTEVDGAPTKRFAVWVSSSNELHITLPRDHADEAEFAEHVQQISLEMARWVHWVL